MDWYVFLSGGFGLLLVLFTAGLPVFVAFLAMNILGLVLLTGDLSGVSLIVSSMYATSTSVSLAAIPMFILLGEILFRTGSVAILFDAVDALVGNFRARLFTVCVVLSTLFGALSGSAMAVTAMMGSSLLPEMVERRYDRRMSIGAIFAGASLAPIIPPSIMAIVLGMLAKVSIASLLVAGILPGLVLAAIFFVYLMVRARIAPELAPASPRVDAPAMERLATASRALPFLLIIATILGLILGGVATPTESAAMGVVAALAVTAAMGKLTLSGLREALGSTAWITAIILIIMACSVSFSQVLNMSGATSTLVRAVTELDWDRWMMFAILQVLPFVLCMFVDQIALMIMLVPIYLPIVGALAFDPVWFWLIFLINMSVGGITPPFGYTLFALKGVAPDVPVQEMYRAVIPFILIFAAAIVGFALMPEIVTYLPSLM
ncbi:TRAP transporter large permease [Ferruginivarius sediminum]|uniref:TRAP transporter large permease protein n=1 Tax=Ferruginivarius sediminum TaxID=2661937 RepID=A0A369T7J6_9PROT|nr:TRAP transporter large permease [Ferruginivarius sediminum]RDD60434.1 TRAP transporter large permease [Ferruginivarius sediminum]